MSQESGSPACRWLLLLVMLLLELLLVLVVVMLKVTSTTGKNMIRIHAELGRGVKPREPRLLALAMAGGSTGKQEHVISLLSVPWSLLLHVMQRVGWDAALSVVAVAAAVAVMVRCSACLPASSPAPAPAPASFASAAVRLAHTIVISCCCCGPDLWLWRRQRAGLGIALHENAAICSGCALLPLSLGEKLCLAVHNVPSHEILHAWLEAPQRSLLVASAWDLNLGEELVQGEVVANRVLPALFRSLEVWKAGANVLVNVCDSELPLVAVKQRHTNEAREGQGRLLQVRAVFPLHVWRVPQLELLKLGKVCRGDWLFLLEKRVKRPTTLQHLAPLRPLLLLLLTGCAW